MEGRSAENMIRVLYVDDEEALLDIGREYLQMSGNLVVDTYPSVSEAEQALTEVPYDAIISDYQMPGTSGIEFLKRLRGKGNKIPFILFTGRGREEVVIEALNSGADFYLQKGGAARAQFAELEHKVREAVRRSRAEQDLRESEAKYRQVVDNAIEGIWVADKDLKTTLVNDNMAAMLGYSKEEMQGRSILDFMDGGGKKLMLENMISSHLGTAKERDMAFLRKDGSTVYTRLVASPIIEHGAFSGAVAFISDVTERKHAEETLRRDEMRTRALLELTQMSGLTPKDIAERSMRIGIELTRSQIGYIAFLNEDESVLTMQHYSKEAMEECRIEKKPMVFDLTRTGLWTESVRQRKTVITNDYGAPSHLKKGLPHGHVPLARHMTVPVFDRDRIVAIIGVGNKQEPYTEDDARELSVLMDGMWRIIRKIQAEEKIRESEERFRITLEGMIEGCQIVDREWRFQYVNEAAERQSKIPKTRLLGHRFMEAWPGVEATPLFRAMERCMAERVPVEMENLFTYPDGTSGWFDVRISPVPEGIFLLSIEITERKRAEEELQQKTALFEAQAAASLDGILVIDDKFQRIMINQRIIDLYHPPQHALDHPEDDRLLLNHVISLTKYPERFQEKVNYLNEHIEETSHDEVEYKNGMVLERYSAPVFGKDGRYYGRTWTFHDVTERKRIEESLREAGRKLNLLSSITRHDMNNQLMVLRSNLELLDRARLGPPLEEHLRRAEAASNRISAIIDFAREYEGIGVQAPAWHNVRDLVQSCAKEVPLDHVTLVNDLPEGLEIYADPMIKKVFFNLIDNALRHGEKVTRIKISYLSQGDMDRIVVEDDGVGVLPAIRTYLFTRGIGRNNGLGLFLSREILSITGIALTEEGEYGKGARFVMSVPPSMLVMK